jgi:ATP-binding cassette, subfamily C (CFTR/MRP), member 1
MLLLYIQRKMNKRFDVYTKRKMALAEERVKKISEFIDGVKIVKFMAWEELLYNKIDDIRKKETSLTFKVFNSMGLSYLLITLIPMICAIVSI